jgi:hypothetical protein
MERITLPNPNVYVIPNALVAERFKPAETPPSTETSTSPSTKQPHILTKVIIIIRF